MASGAITPEEVQSWNQQAENIFRQTVSALAYIHSQGIAHRDVKPANILLTEDGSVRLGDFGLATVLGRPDCGSTSAVSHTIEPQLQLDPSMHTQGVGTPSYASPEQLSGRKYGVQVDVYALGVILAELLFPVQTNMERALLLEGLRGRHLVSARDSKYPGATSLALVLTSLDPTDRPTAAELEACLGLVLPLAGGVEQCAQSCKQLSIGLGRPQLCLTAM